MGLLTQALRAFHCGTRVGTGATVTLSLQPGPPADAAPRLGPYVRTLVAAGLGGLVLLGTVGAARADGGVVQALHLENARAPGTATAADGAALVRLATSGGFLPFSGGPASEAANERLMACIVAMRSADIPGPVAVKVASITGLRAKAPGDGARLAPRMSEADFTAFATLHEKGHCEDETLLGASALNAKPDAERLHLRYLWENFADVYAVLSMVRKGDGTAVAQEWADLRAIGVLVNGARGAGGTAWAHYLTTPAVDAAIAWVDQVGPDAVRILSDAQLTELARRLVQENTLDRAAHARFVQAVPRVRLRDGRPLLPGGLPVGFAARVDRALARTGVTLAPDDLQAADGAPPPAAPSH